MSYPIDHAVAVAPPGAPLAIGDKVTVVCRNELVEARVEGYYDNGDIEFLGIAVKMPYGCRRQPCEREGKTWVRGWDADAKAMLRVAYSLGNDRQ